MMAIKRYEHPDDQLAEQEEKSDKAQIISALTKLAIRRQAEVDIATLSIYAGDVFNYTVDWGTDLDTVTRACDKLGLALRKEYESAFPPVGNILAQIESLDADRQRKDQQAWRDKQKHKQLAAPVSKDEAADWLGKIKKAAHGVKVER